MSTPFRIGDLTIHRIVELEMAFRPALAFIPALTPELLAENRSWMQPQSLDAEDRLIFCFQSYIVRTPHHTILVDSCIGNNKERPQYPPFHRRTDDTWLRGLAAVGLTVADIDIVMCTHLHVDHVGWNTRLENGRWVPTFPNARYLFSAKELAYWTERNAATPLPYIQDSVVPIVEAKRCDLIASDHALDDQVRLLPTAGHTPDHFSVQLGRGAEAVLTGDLIHSPIQARYPALSTIADYDPGQAAVTRRRFLETCCEANTLCCFAHFPSPSRAYVEPWDDGFRFEFVA